MKAITDFLAFADHGAGCHKWYARTATGEIAYSDTQGLYQWHDGQRIDYSGGDRQCSSDEHMHTLGIGGPQPHPIRLGLLAAVSPARRN
ncbi:hypothetical protein [Actinomadura rudentiformis]|uniref:Uncharacterized protein n=1 Tax=Actinomadura rudentiformis TaxID=359158 RepID=A0A6H9Z0C2_9ACTN|nr:hypothetical protein [Actinomadura rudentiformis]KAB2347311.1 hypothetical protein F8566_20070 [Actinomadura rudentiformis]